MTASDLGTWLIGVARWRTGGRYRGGAGNQRCAGRGAEPAAIRGELPRAADPAFKGDRPRDRVGHPAIDVAHRVTGEMQTEVMGGINDYNSALPELSAESGATFVALPPMPTPHTVDGAHLNAADLKFTPPGS
jgi:hypothetical protein